MQDMKLAQVTRALAELESRMQQELAVLWPLKVYLGGEFRMLDTKC